MEQKLKLKLFKMEHFLIRNKSFSKENIGENDSDEVKLFRKTKFHRLQKFQRKGCIIVYMLCW